MKRPVVVAITGASGVIYGVELLKVLGELGLPRLVIMSRAAELNLTIETDYTPRQVRALAEAAYGEDDLAAPPASGSFPCRGMIVAPCSIKTLSAIANSYDANLVVRAADVMLKERRPLVLMVRETPLHRGQLELMARAASLGADILPPVPAFYHRPRTIEDLIHHSLGKALDLLGIRHQLFARWQGAPRD